MKLIPFTIEHLDLFDWRDEELEVYETGSQFQTVLSSVEKNGEAGTMIHEGRILVIMGIVNISKKTGYCFTLFSRHSDLYPVLVARAVKRQLRVMIELMGLHRVVTYNRQDMTHHHKWCEWLGFKLEATVKKFDDNGNTYLQYALWDKI